jgi:hypothetical protein
VERDDRDRRRAPRAEYSVTTVVYLAQARFTARVLNLSATGLLLIPPVDAEVGAPVHLNLTLPGLDEIIAVDGTLAREEDVEGYRAWGIELRGASDETQALIEAYVGWVRRREEQLDATLGGLPVSGGRPGGALERTKTGPAHELVLAPSAPTQKAPSSNPSPGGPLLRRPTDPNLGPVELEEPDLLTELRDLYRETLERVNARSQADSATQGKRKKGWFR